MNTNTLAAIADTKQYRKDLDDVLQRLKKAQDASCYGDIVPVDGIRQSEARQIATVKLQEAIMWLGMDLKSINEESPGAAPNPYPQSYNPASPVIDPTSEGLKL